jgi:hypothetical protein
MWPQRRDGTWPEFCDPSSHIDMDQLDDLMDDMEHDWPSWSSADEVITQLSTQGWSHKVDYTGTDLQYQHWRSSCVGCRCTEQ